MESKIPPPLEVRIVLIDPSLEREVLRVLSASKIEVNGRYLAVDEIESDDSSRSILITSIDCLGANLAREIKRDFRGVIIVGARGLPGIPSILPTEIDKLPTMVRDFLPISDDYAVTEAEKIFIGVLPRVGAGTLQKLFEEYAGSAIFLIKKKRGSGSRTIYCTEIDDASILKLFTVLDSDLRDPLQVGVLVNKVPRTRKAQTRIKAIGHELQRVGISQICPLPYDEQLQVTGVATKRTSTALHPLFDWILAAN